MSEGAGVKKEKEQERHPLCFYFNDTFLFRFSVMVVKASGGGGGSEGGGGAAKVAALNELL